MVQSINSGPKRCERWWHLVICEFVHFEMLSTNLNDVEHISQFYEDVNLAKCSEKFVRVE